MPFPRGNQKSVSHVSELKKILIALSKDTNQITIMLLEQTELLSQQSTQINNTCSTHGKQQSTNTKRAYRNLACKRVTTEYLN